MSFPNSIEAQTAHPIMPAEELTEADSIGVSTLAGKYQNDPTLREICDEAYQLRDAETQAM